MYASYSRAATRTSRLRRYSDETRRLLISIRSSSTTYFRKQTPVPNPSQSEHIVGLGLGCH